MSANQSYSYSGMSSELLAKVGAQIGDKISVGVRKGGVEEQVDGILMPRIHSGEEDCLVVGLRTGYNIGIRPQNVTSINVTGKGAEPHFHGRHSQQRIGLRKFDTEHWWYDRQ